MIIMVSIYTINNVGCFVGWRSFAVEGFWALWDNIITVAVVILLREAYYVLYVSTIARQLL
jgi:hypothetical protein